MKLTYEDKLKIIKLYEQGYGSPSIGKKMNVSGNTIDKIVRRYKIYGNDCLKHTKNKKITPDIKLEIINKWKNGYSITQLKIEYLVTDIQIRKWIQQYEKFGYNGLKIDNRGRPKSMSTKKKPTAKPLEESEREELIRLREENKQLEMENYLLKKLRALVQQRNQQPPKKK